jgi:transcriptional regulator with XRE-family HTH domain
MTHGSLALRLRVLRAEQALTIEQAAARAGVTPETISDAERGRRHPYLPTLRKLAAAYGVPVEELLAREAEESEVALAGSSPKAPAPPETGPASLPEIELEQLHQHDIVASPADARVLNMYLEGLWRAQRTGEPFAIASLAKDNVDHERIALLATYVLSTTREPRFFTPEMVEAVNQGIRNELSEPTHA